METFKITKYIYIYIIVWLIKKKIFSYNMRNYSKISDNSSMLLSLAAHRSRGSKFPLTFVDRPQLWRSEAWATWIEKGSCHKWETEIVCDFKCLSLPTHHRTWGSKFENLEYKEFLASKNIRKDTILKFKALHIWWL